MNPRIFTATAAGLLLAACAHPREDPIANYTRAYVEGRISLRRYNELCHAANARNTYAASHSTSSDTSDTSTQDDSKHPPDPPHQPAPGTAPPPGTVPFPQPPPEPK
jgi:hypothetical protein